MFNNSKEIFYIFLSSLFMLISFVESENTLSKTATQDAIKSTEVNNVEMLFNVEGKALLRNEMSAPLNWQANSRVLLDYGKYIGFIRNDGQFIIGGVPSGSYIVEITNTDYIFEALRIDITSKGKIRARKLNLLQPNAVTTLPYPLQIVARQPSKYFRIREEWRVTDILMNPMVLMLLVAFFLMVVTPKLAAQDPQTQKELQNMQVPKMDMPDMADMFASFFGGGSSTNTKKAVGPSGGKRSTANQSGISRKNR